MISVIDMPPPDESSWWRGKKGFEVGFFPSECVEVIGDKVPHTFKLSSVSTKPVFRRHGKLIAFFRSFLLSRPSRRKLKQSGILKERVFGCDLGEHLLNTGREIPMVLKCCAEFIEEYGVVDGIYRLSGVSSNIQRLRLAFDEDRPLNLGDPATVHDIHSVASLLKMYFRELPNPLLTYQLYDKFVSAVQSSEDVRLLRVRDVVQQLPPPHFRTLQYLLRHLARVASHEDDTGMTPKNIAIVWAPNLLRSRDVENGGVGALHVVGVQAVLTEYLIRFADLIFDEKVSLLPGSELSEGFMLRARPKSLAISTPTKLLSLEEARARAFSTHLPLSQQKYIEVGGGPEKLPSKYHTVIELPTGKHNYQKLKKSPSGWKSFFSRGWYSGSVRDKSRQAFRTSRKASTGSLPHPSAYTQEKSSSETDAPYNNRKKLRTVKSAESLIQCIKESPQSANNEDACTCFKPSPQVSVDSSHSSSVTSPAPKSPGLQKHTRSSSHESYFESSSIDIMSDPGAEEDQGLFYYVNEQMKMLQGSSLPWNSPDPEKSSICIKDTIIKNEIMMDCAISDCEIDRNIEKQKSTEAYVQKLSKTNKNSLESSLDYISPKIQTESIFHNNSSPKDNYILFKSDQDDFVWRSEGDHSGISELAIDPDALYDIIKNRNSVTSSDAETESNNKTVVERYGNAETVLVEVHATQDSSSEEEQCFNMNYDLGVSESELPSPTDEKSCDKIIDVSAHDMSDKDSVESLKSPSPLLFSDFSLPVREETTEVEEQCKIGEIYSGNLSSDICDVPSQNRNIESTPILSPSVGMPGGDSFNVCKSTELCDSSLQSNSSFSVKSDTGNDLAIKSQDSSSIISPAIHPPKSLKLYDFHTRAKMETVPMDKKKPIKIPSPTSPVEEVRKKFEQQSSRAKMQHVLTEIKPVYVGKDCSTVEYIDNESLSEALKSIPTDNGSPKYENKTFSKFDDSISSKSETKISHVLEDGLFLKQEDKMSSKPVKIYPKLEDKMSSKLEDKTSPKLDKISPNREGKISPKLEGKISPKLEGKTSPKLEGKISPKFEGSKSLKLEDEISLRSENKSPTSVKTNKLEDLKINKRHSEPPPKSDISPNAVSKRMSNKYEDKTSSKHAEKVNKPKAQQPSLFTQLKIRKLQSLQAEVNTPSEPIDPWSDPILDMQEDYHPMVYCPSYFNTQSEEMESGACEESQPNIEVKEEIVNEHEQNIALEIEKLNKKSEITSCIEMDVATDATIYLTKNPSDIADSKSDNQNVNKSKSIEAAPPESEAEKRERINRIKEERRAQLREKLKHESFRLEAEEKERVQSKFRLRKDCCKLSNSEEEIKNVKKSDKAVETDSADITETGTNCDLGVHELSNVKTLVKGKSESDMSCKLKKDDYIFHKSSKSRTCDDKCKWMSMPSTDIRDKVAMFERSKETKELCRLGPNGKFPPKQSPSALTSSFVR